MASAIASTSQKSTLSAWFRISATPDCLEMTTGTPDRMASSGEIPKGSETEGITYTLLIAYIRSTSMPLRKPVKWKRLPKPKEATWRTILCSISPEPAITNSTFLSFSITKRAASTKYSGPFW